MSGNSFFSAIGKSASDQPPVKEVDAAMDNFKPEDVQLKPRRKEDTKFNAKYGIE
jgi:hypothetical protein